MFKWLDVNCVGTDTVVFKLEYEATVKVKVDIERAGKAIDFANRDGTAHYNIGAGTKVTVILPERKFWVPKSQIQAPPRPSEKPPPTTITQLPIEGPHAVGPLGPTQTGRPA